MTWSFVFLNAEVKAELDALAEDTRASFERIVRLVQTVGLERVHEPYIKHIEERIWEIRLRGRGGIARALYVTATGRRVVILRVFVKKTQKTPRREIELARQRAREVIREGRSSWSRSPLPPRVRTRPTTMRLRTSSLSPKQ